MRRLFLHISMSLDGYINDDAGAIDLRFADDEFQRYIDETLESIDGMVYGRVTFEQLAAFWPNAGPDTSPVQVRKMPETTWLSVDLSHLGLDVDPQRCVEHLAAIASALPAGRRIQVGAEDYDRTIGCWAARWRSRDGGWRTVSAPPCRRTSAARAGTWTSWSARACTSGS